MKLGVRQVYLHTQPMYYRVFAKFIFTHSPCTTGCSPRAYSHTALVLPGVRQEYLHTQPLYYRVFAKSYLHTQPMHYRVFAKTIFTHSPCTTGCSPRVSSHTALVYRVFAKSIFTHSPCTRISTTFLEQLRYLKVLTEYEVLLDTPYRWVHSTRRFEDTKKNLESGSNYVPSHKA